MLRDKTDLSPWAYGANTGSVELFLYDQLCLTHRVLDLLKVAWQSFFLLLYIVYVLLKTARRSNQSILKEINPDDSLEGLMQKLKLTTLATWSESQLVRKDPDAGKEWGQEEKRVTEDEMVGRQHRLKTPGGSEAQGSLVCCCPCGRKETWRLNKNHKLRELRKVHPTLSLEEPKSPPAPQWQMKRIPFFLNEENWGRKGGHEERTCWVERKGAWETVRGKLGSTDGSGLWIKPHFNLSPPRVFSSASQGIPFVLFFFN